MGLYIKNISYLNGALRQFKANLLINKGINNCSILDLKGRRDKNLYYILVRNGRQSYILFIIEITIDSITFRRRLQDKMSTNKTNEEGGEYKIATHPASWEQDQLKPQVECNFVESEHPASVKLVEKDETISVAKKAKGNEYFAAKEYENAIDCYSEAIEYAPVTKDFDKQRAVFYSNRAACHCELKNFEPAVADATSAIELDPTYVKAYIRRIKANESLDKLDECLADMDAVLKLEPNQPKFRLERNEMEQRVKEKHEKLKAEMIGTMKDLGNKVLGLFGMSVDNFKVEQDPVTGSYSLSMKQ